MAKFNLIISKVKVTYAGEPDCTPEAFLAKFSLYVQQQRVRASEQASQPIRLTNDGLLFRPKIAPFARPL